MIPLSPYIMVYLALFLIVACLGLVVDGLNTVYFKRVGNRVPQEFQGFLDDEKLMEMSRYTLDNTRFAMLQSTLGKCAFLTVILSGLLPWLSDLLTGMNAWASAMTFFAVLAVLSVVFELPFSWYHNFVIEERFGFNTKTIRIWITDLLKSLLVGGMIGGLLLSAILGLIYYTGRLWWVLAWGFFMGFQLLMTVLYPTVIAPMFNTFSPIEDDTLRARIEGLSLQQGFRIKGIFQMDATKRTRHTNAYFTGLGATKRIVLYDSLLSAHTHDEILAILAHEIGHMKNRHLIKQVAMTATISMVLFYLASRILTAPVAFETFGFSNIQAYVGLFLVGVLWEPVSFFLSPVAMAVSRRFEREADFYACRTMSTGTPLITALKKMARENLANLRPHPLYVWFNYSHPPLLQRIRYMASAWPDSGSVS
jgi:STE24 endopeptidase